MRSLAIKRKILVIDDSELFYSWLKIELGNDFDIEYAYCPAMAFISSLDQHYYSLIIQDSKIKSLIYLLENHSSPIFLITDEHTPIGIHNAREYGMAGYFLKTEPPRLLIRAILNPSLRKFWVTERKNLIFKDLPNFAQYNLLTIREKEIFTLLADGMNYKEIGFKLGISSKTVLSHRERLMKKMNFETNTDLIKAALKLGVTQL